LATALQASARKAIRLSELWDFWNAADPASAGRPDRRQALSNAVDELVAAGVIQVSKTLDTTARPHLPTRLTLPSTTSSATAAALARSVIWRPELAWVIEARLAPGQVARLKQVNTWLRDNGRDCDVLPIRERSLQIFGHEKELDQFVATGVFGPGRLTLDLLRTFRTHPPLPSVQVGDGPVLLVVENDNTFNSIRSTLAADPGPVGFLAWGAGGAFEASVRSCGELAGITCIRYFGDLDFDGLRIPRNAAATAAAEGLQPLLPAEGLYRRLLGTAAYQPNQPSVLEEQLSSLISWIPDPPLAEEISALLSNRVRIPQEALNLSELQADPTWIAEL
jgi:hypothetical protein